MDLAHRVGDASLRHLEHHVLGLVDRPENVLGAGVAEIGDLVRRFDQAPQQVRSATIWAYLPAFDVAGVLT